MQLLTTGKRKLFLALLAVAVCGAIGVVLVRSAMQRKRLRSEHVSSQEWLAKIGDRKITLSEVNVLVERIAHQQFPGRQLSPELLPLFRQSVAEQLLLRDALALEAHRRGMHVSDAELQDYLRHGQFGELFFPQQTFVGQDAYARIVQHQFGMNIPDFEQMLKTQLLIRKLAAVIEQPVSVSPQEAEQESRRQNTKVKFEYAVLSPADVMKQIHPTTAELKEFYDTNKKLYDHSIPEKRKVQYVVIDSGKFQHTARVTASDLQNYYQQHQSDFRLPDAAEVRHIFIRFPDPGLDGIVDQKATETARTKAQNILSQLRNGADFNELAKRYSDDSATAAKGGSLGWIPRGQAIPELDKAIFSLAPGQTSGLVQSGYGFDIIRVEHKQNARVETLAEVKPRIEQVLGRERAQAQAEKLANAIVLQASKQGLEQAASAQGLQVQTHWVARTDPLPGVPPSPQVTNALLAAGLSSPPQIVRTAQQQLVIYRVEAIQPASTPTFEQAKDQVESDLQAQRAATIFPQKVQELATKAKTQHTLETASKALGAKLSTSAFVTLGDQVAGIGPMSGPVSLIFGLSPGEVGGPLYVGRNGVVVQLLQKQEPAPATVEKSIAQTRESLLQQKRQQAMQLFTTDLREHLQKEGTIRLNRNEWNRSLAGDTKYETEALR